MMQQEANEINEQATKRQVEELFKSIKSDGSTFKSTKQMNKCDPDKLIDLIRKHFDLSIEEIFEPCWTERYTGAH